MPVHDWTRMQDGDFHHFHQRWIQSIADNLNNGGLPPEFMALSDQVTGRSIPDVVALRTNKRPTKNSGLAVAAAPPTAKMIAKFERSVYSKRADRVVIRHGRGEVVAIIAIVSPGNKSSSNAIRTFVQKSAEILNQGIHLLVVDLFPPTSRDPKGLQKSICDEFDDLSMELPSDKPLTIGSYLGGDLPEAYIDYVGIGDSLPSTPLFLTDEYHIPAPLEATYMEAWKVYPAFLKEIIEHPDA